MTFWVPDGNAAQTRLDVRVEALRAELARYNPEISKIGAEVTVLTSDRDRLRDAISFLKSPDAQVVSISEFKDLRVILDATYKKISYAEEKNRVITGKVDELRSQIEELLASRDQLGTKILEFKQRGQ